MIHELADCVERLGAMRATRSNDAVELIVEGVEIMLTEFSLCGLKDRWHCRPRDYLGGRTENDYRTGQEGWHISASTYILQSWIASGAARL